MPLFKNIVVYRIGADWQPPPLEQLDAELQRLAFRPCEPGQERSVGWLPPRAAEHAAMVESVQGQWILKLGTERKAVPASVVRAELEAKCKALEAERGRAPGRKEKKELKEEIVLTLLPRAFAKRSSTTLWIDLAQRLLVIAAGSLRAAEPAVTELVNVMADLKCVLPLAPLSTSVSPSIAMGEWLTAKEAPAGFTIDRDLELKHAGEEKSVVRYARHSLDLDEIGEHIQEGKQPTQLALTWNDKVSFVLTEQLSIRKIDIRGVEDAPKGEDGFDADVAITTGELSMLLPQLVESLGGEARL